jgi:hydrogenase/urease accessory protein HupE
VGFADVRALRRLLPLLALLAAAPASAHEIGTTQVNATFRKDHTYVIDIITGGDSLLARVEHRAGLPRSPQLAPAAVARRLELLAPQFLREVDLRFSGVAAQPRMNVLRFDVPDGMSPSSMTIRLTGEIPRQARDVTWQYKLTYSAYSLASANEGQGEPLRQWLEGDQRSAPFVLSEAVRPPTRLEVARQYLVLGFTHIVPYGLDHILFVLGIFLLSTRLKPVLLQVTAFTIAHSITLGLTMYGLLSVSPRFVEPMIALSIAYVAIENLMTRELKPWRVAIVFLFGLLHGMGFAGVLRELGLPRSEALTALVSFNVGVEAGQLTVIAAAFLLVASWARTKPWYRYRFVIPSSAAIAAMGIFWTVQRVMG